MKILINNTIYNIWRYPDFLNEKNRHTLSYMNDYMRFFFKKYINKKSNYILEFTSYHGVLDNKLFLWKNLVKSYGIDRASLVIPNSYIIPTDVNRFISDNKKKKKKFILKNVFMGGKTGITVTNSYQYVLDIFNKYRDFNVDKCQDAVCLGKIRYNIVQEYLDKPLLIKGFKFNFRFYLVIFWNNNKLSWGIYNDFRVAYSNERFDVKDIDDKKKILTSWGDYFTDTIKLNRPYDRITFIAYMKKKYKSFSEKRFEDEIREKFDMIFNSNKRQLSLYCINNTKQFQVYAIDSEMDKNFNIKIYEANVYFSTYKHIIGKLHASLYQDIYNHLNLSPYKNDKFIMSEE